MIYNENTAMLYVCGSSNEIYRLHLEQGRFYSPLVTSSKTFNCAQINPINSLLAFGSSEGNLHFFDPREPKELSCLDVQSSLTDQSIFSHQITALRFNDDGLKFVAGTSSGNCLLYDLRKEKPLLIYDHKYGYPIKTIRYHSHDTIVSADKKIIKIWNANDGEMITNIEPQVDINEFCILPRISSNFSSSLNPELNLFSSSEIESIPSNEEIEKEKKKNSGLILIAPEKKENMGYFIPTLGPAPTWCSFLDNLTEEMQNQKVVQNHYEDYKFVTRDELDKLALSDVVGTNLVKPYMHGFFISMKLYQKMKAVIDPFAWQRYKKERIRNKIEESKVSRIFNNPINSQNKKSSNVNKQLAEAITDASTLTQKSWSDTRFTQQLFNNPNFEIDPNSTDFARVEKFNSMKNFKQNKKDKIAGFTKLDEQSSEEEQEDNEFYEVDEELNQIALNPNREQILTKTTKTKKRLLGDRISNQSSSIPQKKRPSNTISFIPKEELDKINKQKAEIKKRKERNKSRRKASFK